MSELEKNYRNAPKFTSPISLDESILRASKTAPHIGVSRTAVARKRRSWLKPSMAFASLCTVVIGVSIALQSGLVNQSAPYSLDVGRNSVSDELAGVSGERANSPEKMTAAIAETAIAAPNQTAKASVAELNSAGQLVMLRESEGVNLTRVEEDTVAEQLNEEGYSMDGASVATAASENTNANVSVEIDLNETVMSDADALGEVPMADEQMGVARSTQGSVRKGKVSSAQQSEAKQRQPQNTQSGLVAAPRIQSKLSRNSNSSSSEGGDRVEADGAPKAMASQGTGVPVNLWLLKQDSERYTVQLAASATALSLEDFARGLDMPTEIVRLSSGSAPWVLLHGSFAQQEDADKVLASITRELTEQGLMPAIGNVKIVRFEEIQ